MDPSDDQHQAPEPQWIASVSDVNERDVNTLQRRVSELEEQVRTYEALLEDLPDLFERKFQQRLEPLGRREPDVRPGRQAHLLGAEGQLPQRYARRAPGQLLRPPRL